MIESQVAWPSSLLTTGKSAVQLQGLNSRRALAPVALRARDRSARSTPYPSRQQNVSPAECTLRQPGLAPAAKGNRGQMIESQVAWPSSLLTTGKSARATFKVLLAEGR